MKHCSKSLSAAVIACAMLLGCTACGGQSSEGTSSFSAASVTPNMAQTSSEPVSQSDTGTSQKADETLSSGDETQDSTQSPQESSEASKEPKPGELPELPDDDGTDVGFMSEGILIYNRTAYEMFYGYDDLAKNYANAISNVANALGDKVKVYNVVVPTHCGVTLPERIMNEYNLPDQKEYINTIYSSYTAKVTGVNVFDALALHRNEYLYFNSDHHWTALAAYYAYEEFCKAAGVEAISLSKMEEGTIEGYYGSLTAYIDESLVNADTVHYYSMDVDTSTVKYDSNAQNEESTSLLHTYASGPYAYGVFLGGDSPLIVCKNKDGNGKKIAVVKESYGNAISPFIAYTYSETHLIDFRDIDFDFLQYIRDNGIDEVVFVNNTMASATTMRCDELNALVGG